MKKILNVSMKIAFNGTEEDLENLEKTLKHHIEGLIDVDNWPEIENIFGVKSERKDYPE